MPIGKTHLVRIRINANSKVWNCCFIQSLITAIGFKENISRLEIKASPKKKRKGSLPRENTALRRKTLKFCIAKLIGYAMRNMHVSLYETAKFWVSTLARVQV